VSFADGLSLAGNLPADIAADGLCAIAPTLLQRIDAHLLNTNVGDLNAMTLHCARSTVTFFRHENICLAALHANGELTGDVRRCLTEMAERLSRTYSQPKASHVHH
jgi:predicted regulator of Ras-like GTPase activity (Roadblock/LC7/MglB family)